jgi:hypothetical protein
VEDPRSLLAWHLLGRLNPPIPDDLVATAEVAVDLVRAGAPDRPVDLPGGSSVAAAELVEALHLGRFTE